MGKDQAGFVGGGASREFEFHLVRRHHDWAVRRVGWVPGGTRGRDLHVGPAGAQRQDLSVGYEYGVVGG